MSNVDKPQDENPKNFYHVELLDEGKEITAISKDESGEIFFSIRKVAEDGKSSHARQIKVTLDNRIVYADIDISHSLPGISMSSPTDLRDGVDEKLANKIRETYKGLSKDKVLKGGNEVDIVHGLIDEAQKKIPEAVIKR